MLRRIAPTLALLVLAAFVSSVRADALEDTVINPSVRVKARSGTGSGTIFGHEGTLYVVTAAHVIEGDKELKEVEVPNEKGDGVEKKKKVFWPAIDITRTLYHDGKEVGELRLKCDVVAYSAAEEHGGQDVAVLKIRHQDTLKHKATWGDSGKLKLGDDLIHVGNPYGDISGCFIKGSVMRLDYHPEGLHASFFVGSFGGARPGSSGGGVWTRNGDAWVFVGMITRGDQGGLILVKPTAEILKILKEHKLESLAGK